MSSKKYRNDGCFMDVDNFEARTKTSERLKLPTLNHQKR